MQEKPTPTCQCIEISVLHELSVVQQSTDSVQRAQGMCCVTLVSHVFSYAHSVSPHVYPSNYIAASFSEGTWRMTTNEKERVAAPSMGLHVSSSC